jgi:hypothetical protein
MTEGARRKFNSGLAMTAQQDIPYVPITLPSWISLIVVWVGGRYAPAGHSGISRIRILWFTKI